MRLIDADAIPESAFAISSGGRLFIAWSEIVKAPIIEAEPVRHGRWVYNHWCEFKCSECGHFSDSKPYKGREPYCPNCGAKMDLK